MEIELTAKDVIEHGSVHEYMWTNYPNTVFEITHVGANGIILVYVIESENDNCEKESQMDKWDDIYYNGEESYADIGD